MAEVWDEHWFGSTKTLDVHVAAPRRKLAALQPHAAVPNSVMLRGRGFRFEPPEQQPEAQRTVRP
jgi:DNA-binding response OmpR family regulator